MPEKGRLRMTHFCLGFFTVAIISCLIWFFFSVSKETFLMLAIFNFFFISLIFPLKGKLEKKIMLLFVGNIVGLLWNNIFSLLAYATVYYIGEIFNVIYIILNPFLNLIWIVSFWAISLSFLVNSKDNVDRDKT